MGELYVNTYKFSFQIDNSENILKVLKKLWEDQSMCDIYLKVGNKQFGAHRFILSATSDVFQVSLFFLMQPSALLSVRILSILSFTKDDSLYFVIYFRRCL